MEKIMVTEELRAVINETAYRVAKEVVSQREEFIAQELKLHAAQCPVKADVDSIKYQAKGAKAATVALWSILTGASAFLAWGLERVIATIANKP